MSAVEEIRDNMFQAPCALEKFHVGVPSREYVVKNHKGELMQVSPEESSAAFLFAIARDIQRKEPEE
eukprot:8531304-Lingulodinium_polyedra.AAC.1